MPKPMSGGAGPKPVTELLDLDVLEISLVPSGANGKRYALLKSADAEEGGIMEEELVKKVLETPFDDESAITEGLLKAVPDMPTDAQEAAVGIVKLAKTFKDKLPDDIFNVTSELAGYAVKAKSDDEDEEEDGKTDGKGDGDEEDDDEMKKTKKVKKEGEKMESPVTIEKIEKAEDIEKLAPELRAPLLALWKQNEESRDEIRKMKEEALDKEFIRKSSEELSWLPKDENFAMTLKSLYKADPELYGKIEKSLVAANNALGESDLFVEKGTTRFGENSPLGKVEALAQELVVKSTDSMTIEQARAKAVELHPEWYDEYRNETPILGGRSR